MGEVRREGKTAYLLRKAEFAVFHEELGHLVDDGFVALFEPVATADTFDELAGGVEMCVHC